MIDSKINTPDYEQALVTRIKLTKDSRYNGSRRLSCHNLFSNTAMIALSIESIIVALYQVFYAKQVDLQSQLNFTTISISVLLLAISIVIGMSNFSHRSEQMRSCARDLGKLLSEIHFINESGPKNNELLKIKNEQYFHILEKHEQHTFWDHLKTRADNKFKNRLLEAFSTLIHLAPCAFIYFILLAIPTLCFIYICFAI